MSTPTFNQTNSLIQSATSVGQNDSFASIYIGATSVPSNTTASDTYQNNTGIGNLALNELTTGQDNTAVGSLALRRITSGAYNTVIGRGAGSFIQAGTGNTIMGSNAFADADGSINTGGSSFNTIIGYEAGKKCSLGNGPSNDVICIGSGADVLQSGSTNEIVIGKNAIGNGSNTTTIGNNNTTTTHIKGDIQIESDRRLKKNIKSLKNTLSKLIKLEGKQYNLKHKSKNKKINIGLIAQEVKEIFPELVCETPNKDKTLSINYIGMIPILINALKEQQNMIKIQEKMLNKQSKILRKNQNRINILEKINKL